jgi:hypothetical protein
MARSSWNWQEAFFFAVAVAVGLTPEMLPMIVDRLPVAPAGHRQAAQLDPEPRCDGCIVHRQDRDIPRTDRLVLVSSFLFMKI